MPEVAHTGEHHRHLGFVRCVDDFFVAHGATGLNDGGNASLRSIVDAIPKRKKASEAITAPRTSRPACSALIAAIRAELTRDICPAPTPIVRCLAA